MTNAGLDYLGLTGFTAGAQITTWYAGLIDLVGFSTLAAADIMSSHVGWRENTQYSGNRPVWTNTEGGQQVNSNGPFTFTITGTGTIHGLFITSSNTLGGTTGTLWATAVLSQDAQIASGQSVTGTYSIVLAGG